MINKKIGVLLLFALLISFGAKAQRATSMRINEVLVINEDNFVDDYGKRHGWIELFNTSAGTVTVSYTHLDVYKRQAVCTHKPLFGFTRAITSWSTASFKEKTYKSASSTISSGITVHPHPNSSAKILACSLV